MPRKKSAKLTPRQAETLEWIKEFIQEHEVPPTVREIGRAFGIKSSSVFALLKAIEKKGFLSRGGPGARSIVVEKPGAQKIQILGRVAAGRPILAVEDDLRWVSVPRKLLGGQQGYGLRVVGHSMKDAGILNGDYVIVRAQDTAEDGDIVVALIEDEATLKTFHREGDRVRLEAANPEVEPIYVDSGEFRLQGKVVGVQRVME